MIKRVAYFEGTIKPGREAEFHAFVAERLIPLWTLFPGALRVMTQREVAIDEGRPAYPLVLEISYPSLAAMDAALASPVRAKARAASEVLLAMLDGRVTHAVYEASEHALAATV
jgi:hypothetical protein